MKKFKRIFAGMAAAVMAFSNISLSASASESDYSDSWEPLYFAPGAPSSYIRTSSYASIKPRINYPTFTIGTTLSTNASAYMVASSTHANNNVNIYITGQSYMYFTNTYMPTNQFVRVDVMITGFNQNTTISASGSVYN